MWLVSYRRQGMLTEGPLPDPKCKLNISSLLAIPYLLDCLICARDIMKIALLLHDGAMVMLGVVHLCQDLGKETGGGQHCFFIFPSAFVLLLIVLSWWVHDSSCACSIVSFFAFSFSDPFNWVLLVHGKCCFFLKQFQKSGFRSLVCGFP